MNDPEPFGMRPTIDPRAGDVEDDALSTKQRSLFSLAGSLMAEVSLPKLALAWISLIFIPSLVLGLAPLVAFGWLSKVSQTFAEPLTSAAYLSLLLLLLVLAWFGGRSLLRGAERSFWSLQSLAIQPGYAVCREGLRHLAERMLPAQASDADRARLRAIVSAAAGVLLCVLALWIAALAWTYSQWIGNIADLVSPAQLALTALANSIVLIACYSAIATLVWSIADAIMAQPSALPAFDRAPAEWPAWRVAHLSDLHIVGERYGFRIESGRSGAQGNGRLRRVFAQLNQIHAQKPLDAVLITGDMTDSGRSAEWAEFFDTVVSYPDLAQRILMIPGNHDLNVVDRANPARLDLPSSPNKRLRQLRMLSAMHTLQGQRVHLVDSQARRLGQTLAATLQPHLGDMRTFSNAGGWRASNEIAKLWTAAFPMVLAPQHDDGLGFILLNSNADTHFSFTNALGLISSDQVRAIEMVRAQYPCACWVVALHHHPVEYPGAAKKLSIRIGTALVNGSRFLRQLHRLADRAVLMHGHRHIDWIGRCAGLLIVSAPSPIMEARNERSTYFYIHTMAVGPDGRLRLLPPERIDVPGESATDMKSVPPGAERAT